MLPKSTWCHLHFQLTVVVDQWLERVIGARWEWRRYARPPSKFTPFQVEVRSGCDSHAHEEQRSERRKSTRQIDCTDEEQRPVSAVTHTPESPQKRTCEHHHHDDDEQIHNIPSPAPAIWTVRL